MAQKVFLSYAHVDADKRFVLTLYERLKRDGVECFFDEDSLAPGANFILQISEAIGACNYLVMIMSAAYFSARFAPTEWAAILADDPKNERGRLLPLLVEECKIPPLLKSLKHIDVSTAANFEKNYPRISQLLGQPQPNDIEERSREIDELFARTRPEQGMKRLLDFARDFTTHREVINRLTAIKWELEYIKADLDETAIPKVRVGLLTEALNLRDGIIGTLSFELSR